MLRSLTLLTLLPTIAFGQSLVSLSPENRTALLEDFTGIHCGYCPEGHAIMASLEALHGSRFSTVGIHAGSFAVPGAGEPDFRTAAGIAIDAYFTISGYPAGVINRHIFNGENDLGRGSWEGAVADMLALPSPVNLGVESTFNTGTNELSVNVELYYTADSPAGNDYISVLVKENHVIGWQTDYGPAGDHAAYDHTHVLRAFATDTWGDQVPNPTSGSTVTRTYTLAVPATWNIANCEVLAFVSEDHSEVYQARTVLADGGTTLFIGGLDNSTPQFVSGTDGAPSSFSSTFNNELGMDDDFVVSLTNNGAPASWGTTLSVNGSAIGNPGNVAISAGGNADVDVSITPDAAPGVGSYTLTITSVTHPGAPAVVREFNVISGITDLVVTHAGAEQWQALYTAGLAQAGNTTYAAVAKDKYISFGQANALGDVNNLYVNVSWTFPSITDDEVALLSTHMDADGDVFIAGQDIGWDQSGATGSYGTPATQAFYTDRMHATYVADGSPTSNIVNFLDADGIFGTLPTTSLSAVFGAANTYPDQITPTGSAVGILHYNTNAAMIGGLRAETGASKLVYLGVGPEQFANADVARAVIEISHDWFYGLISVGIDGFDGQLANVLGQAYPVPANDRITIPVTGLEGSATLEVFDATGRSVMQRNVTKGANQLSMDVSALQAGLYHYAIRTASGLGRAKAFQVVH